MTDTQFRDLKELFETGISNVRGEVANQGIELRELRESLASQRQEFKELLAAQGEDFKQLLKTTVSASEERLTEGFKQLLETTVWTSEKRIKSELMSEIWRLEHKVDDGFASIADTFKDVYQLIDQRTLPSTS